MLLVASALGVTTLSPGIVAAGSPPVEWEGGDPSPPTTAAAARMLLIHGDSRLAVEADDSPVRARSVPAALALSAVLPGAGQAYNRQWIKAAVGVAIEAALFAGYLHYRSRGRDDETAFKEYAHLHWNPAKYALWLQDYSDWLPVVERQDFDVPLDVDFDDPGSWTADQRARVRALFNDIRATEGVVYHPETGAAFSHKLPFFGEQQYYELVGKYFQFAPGWVDYAGIECRPGEEDCRFPWIDEEGAYVDGVIDPERTGQGGSKPNVQGRMLDYARDHAAANDLLRTASRMTSFLVLNHIVAAIDAAVFAKLHNNRVSARLSAEVDAYGSVLPSAHLRIAL